ncbi:LPS assembly lipoprotein LptE [soil metagenome]
MTMTRRAFLFTPFAAALVGCQNGGLFGYTAKPPFDAGIRTVHVPVFKSTALETTPYRDMEVDATSAVVKEINMRTPWRVSSDRDTADTELLGTILNVSKQLTNRNPQNMAREVELVVTCSLVWKDLRTGKVLSNRRPSKRDTAVPIAPFDPSLPPPVEEPEREKAIPVTVVAVGRVLPEVGETTATGMKMAFDKMARQIVNMMEEPW